MPIIPFRVRPLWRTALTALLLGVIAAPESGFSQPVFEPIAKDERQRRIVDEIREEQSENGPFSAALIAPLTALGLMYREDGDSSLAVGAVEQARQVVRANYGLHSLEETPLLQQAIEDNEARGQFTMAWDLEQQLLGLVDRHLDDVRTVPILDEIGDKRMDVLTRYLSGELPPQIVLGCYYADARYEPNAKCTSGSRDRVIWALLRQARSYYTTAITTLIQNERFSSPELHELEMKVIRNSYTSCQPAVELCAGYFAGRDSYRRLISYNAANSASWGERITTAIELADWNLLFLQHAGTNALDNVLDVYSQARQLLKNKGVQPSTIDELLDPSVPVAIPSFLPNPLVSERTTGTTGYVDVGFRITKYGRPLRVRVLDSTTDASRDAQEKLVRSIRAAKFRPRSADGRYDDDDTVVVRYYVSE
jgi:hypothetical protein